MNEVLEKELGDDMVKWEVYYRRLQAIRNGDERNAMFRDDNLSNNYHFRSNRNLTSNNNPNHETFNFNSIT
jgi:hypothetical protein